MCRFSGIKETDLAGVRTTLRDVQAQLLFQVAARDILVGHSLESDLRAVKLLHSRVVDTAIVFPHKMGPPYKRALRTLAVEQIQRIIQNDGGSPQRLVVSSKFCCLIDGPFSICPSVSERVLHNIHII